MPAFWGRTLSVWETGSDHWVGTCPYVGISFQGSNALLQFSGSGIAERAHVSIRYRVSTTAMPTDASIDSASPQNLDARGNFSATTSSFSNGNTLYVKAKFYSGSSGTGANEVFTSTLTKNGDNTNTGSLIWRRVNTLHGWTGASWQQFAQVNYNLTMTSVQVFDTSFFCDGSGQGFVDIVFDGDWVAEGISIETEYSTDFGGSWIPFTGLEDQISTTNVRYTFDLSGNFRFTSLDDIWFRVTATYPDSSHAINSPAVRVPPFACF